MNGVLDFLTRAIPIAIGGGLVQVTIYLLKRRGENRKINVDTDATVVTSAGASVVIASRLRDEALARVEVVESKMAVMQEQLNQLTALVSTERKAIEAANAREAALRIELAILRGSSPDRA